MPTISLLEPGAREGEFYTNSFLVAQNVADTYKATLDLADSDLRDPTFYMELDYYYSNDNGRTWVKKAGMTLEGGDFSWEEMPYITVTTQKLKGKQTRMRLYVNRNTTLGLDIEDI